MSDIRIIVGVRGKRNKNIFPEIKYSGKVDFKKEVKFMDKTDSNASLFLSDLGADSYEVLFENNISDEKEQLTEEIYSLKFEHSEESGKDKKEETKKEISRLIEYEDVQFAEEDYRIKFTTPNPKENNANIINRTKYPYGTINFGPLEKSFESQKIIIAVMDSGIDYNHNYLKNSLWENPDSDKKGTFGFNYTIENKKDCTDVMDFDGHGTHVAGIIAAKSEDQRLQGLVSSAKILSFKLIPDECTYVSDIINAFEKALSIGAKVINCSWIIEMDKDKSIALKKHLGILECRKCIPVFGAGNNEISVEKIFPQNQENVITVGAINNNMERWYDSNYGDKVDIWAPGEQIYSTYIGKNKDNVKPNQGTSMAAPFVTGAIALLLQKNPELNVHQIKKILKKDSTCIEIDVDGEKEKVNLLNIKDVINNN